MMKKESGFVLVTGMVFLVVLTIIVIYMLRGSIMQERMTGNSIDRQRALQAAEATLREAEDRIKSGGKPFDPLIPASFDSACVSGFCYFATPPTSSLWNSITWSNLNNLNRSNIVFHSNKVNKPYYVIELLAWPNKENGLCNKEDVAIYRIIAKGVGLTGAEVVVQRVFKITPVICP